MFLDIDFILVPAGAEYQAVYRGLAKTNSAKPQIIPIPIGSSNCLSHFKTFPDTAKVLLMGLGGSLSTEYNIGDVVIYQDCYYNTQIKQTDSPLTNLLTDKIKLNTRQVRGLTSDRLIYSAAEKINQGQKYQAQVVDMEAFAVLKKFNQAAIIRVISDDCQGDLPDLNGAISSQGKLKPLSLGYEMLKNPVAANRLIQGSLRSLKILTELTRMISSSF